MRGPTKVGPYCRQLRARGAEHFRWRQQLAAFSEAVAANEVSAPALEAGTGSRGTRAAYAASLSPQCRWRRQCPSQARASGMERKTPTSFVLSGLHLPI